MVRGETMVDRVNRRSVISLNRKIEALARYLERGNLVDFMLLMGSPRRLLVTNFFAGIARGFGLAVGFTAIGALFFYLLGRLASLNLPVIGEFIAQMVRIVQHQLSTGRFR